MLQGLRSISNNRLVMMFLFGVTAISMGLFGLPALIHGDQHVAKVGRIIITPTQLDHVFNTEMMDESREQGKFLTRSEALQQGLLTRALAKISMRAQFQQAADKVGLVITDNAMIDAIKREKAFKDKDGTFSRQQFDVAIRQSGLNEKMYIDLVRGDLAQQQIVREYTSGAILPKSIQDDLARYSNEARDAALITLASNQVSLGKDSIKDDVLKEYYEQNKETFRQPEYRSLTILTLGTADLARKITIPESDLRAEYDRQIDHFRTEERRSFVQVLATTEDKAKQIRQKAMKDGSLEKAALSVDAKLNVQPFPSATRNSLTPELADAVFKVGAGKFADIVHSPFGWHVIQVEKIDAAGQRSFEEVKAQIAESLQKQQASEHIFDAGATLEDLVNSGTPLEKAGDQWGIKPVIIKDIDRDGNARDPQQKLPKNADLPKILTEAFRLGEKENSSLLESSEGGYILIRADNITTSTIPALENIRDKVTKAWSDQEKTRINDARSKQIVERLNKGETLEAIARETGSKIVKTTDIKRRDIFSPELGPDGVEALFTLSDKIKAARAPGNDGWMIVTMTGHHPGHTDGALADKTNGQNNRQFGSDMILLYQRALDQRFPVKINQPIMDRMLATY